MWERSALNLNPWRLSLAASRLECLVCDFVFQTCLIPAFFFLSSVVIFVCVFRYLKEIRSENWIEIDGVVLVYFG